MAAEFVGGAFLSASFQVLFERLASKEVLSFIQGKNTINGLLKNLKIMLLSANVVLDDAEQKQVTIPTVRQWLDELKEATFEAQDLIAQIENEALRSKPMEGHGHLGSLRSKALKLISITSFGTLFEKSIEHKLAKLIERFEVLLKQKDVIGLREPVQNGPSDRLLPPTLVEESSVYGRNGDKEALLKLVLSDGVVGNRVSVIPIVGMGGIGKTTLAQLVYDDDKVKRHFDLKAWVTVSYEFEVLRLAKALLEAVASQGSDVRDPYQVQVRLKEGLKGKMFLFVLDDVWNESYARWDALRSLFEYGARGSKVIVTTRCESVASVARNVPIYQLKTISDEDCWSLFVKHAFGSNSDQLTNPNLEVIGRKILQKGKGLPLAVKSLGGLLRYQQNPNKWEKVLNSDIWELPIEENGILPALWLSYYYLPSHLKRCFAYCSIFPKDYKFKKKELVLLWMGEDLLQPRRNKSIEEVGEECFDDLLSRSMFQHSSSKPQRFTMHDLVSDVAAFVSGEFSARLGDDDLHVAGSRTRHLWYNMKEVIHFEKLKALSKAKCLRTFIGIGWKNMKEPFPYDILVHELLPAFQCLRVLSLPNCPTTKLPETIGNMKNLRFLNLSCTEIKEIPDAVCTLYNLQTLLLAFCRYVTQLPTEIGNLTNLRHLDIQGTSLREMPIQLGQLKDLQTLSSFVLGKNSGFRIKVLKELKQLRGDFHICGLENVVDANDAAEANLKYKKHLSRLTLEWEGFQADDSLKENEVLEKLQPHTSLKYLNILSFRGTKFPNWLGDISFCDLVLVYIQGCKNCYLLPPLGQLPLLQQLGICHFDGLLRVGEEFYYSGHSLTKPFGSLKRLIFSRMLEWREWCFTRRDREIENFPVLEDLSLEECPKLNINLSNQMFPSLTSLSVSECQELESLDGLVSNLTSLSISNCGKLIPNCLSNDMQRFKSLRSLKIMDHRDLVDSFPKEGTFLLTHLWIFNLPNLKALNGKAFRCHQSLEELRINGCSQLKCLPEEGLPSSLSYLSIYLCHSLSKRCERDQGQDWPKIAHVDRVCIDGKSVS